jgi:hypothetical protein
VFKKGFATRTQWKMGDYSNPAAMYGTTAANIGANTDPSRVPAAGDRVSGPFKLTGLTAQSKGSNVSSCRCLLSLPAAGAFLFHGSQSPNLPCSRTDDVARVFAERSLGTLGPTTFDRSSGPTDALFLCS